MTAIELYDALREVEQAADREERDKLLDELVKRLLEYDSE